MAESGFCMFVGRYVSVVLIMSPGYICNSQSYSRITIAIVIYDHLRILWVIDAEFEVASPPKPNLPLT